LKPTNFGKHPDKLRLHIKLPGYAAHDAAHRMMAKD
jgi:hypothetical protein